MADEMTKVVKEFVKLLNERDRKAVKPYDTPAKVVRVDGNTAWVHIPGGVDETPVARTTNAMPGDNVQVRISGGRAWLTGNATNPPTDDTRANVAYSYAGVAQETATEAQETAVEANENADRAKLVATNYITDLTNGVFVHAENDNASGVQITDHVDIIRKNESAASFGEIARIGKEEQTHIDIKSNSLIEQNYYLNDATESVSKTQLIYASTPRSYSSEEGKETIALPYDIATGSHFIISAVSNGETLTDEIVFAGGRVHTFVWGSGAETEIDYHGGYELDVYHLPNKQTAYVEMSITYESTDGGLYKASEFEVGSKNDPTSHLASLVESIEQPLPQVVELTGGMFVGIRLRYERPVILDSVIFILDSSYTSKIDVTSAFSLRYENGDYNDAGWYLATPVHYPPGSSNEDDIIVQVNPYCIVVSYKAYQPSPYLSFGRNNTLLAAPETVTFGKNNTAEGFGSFVGGIDSKSDKFGDRSFTWGKNLNNYLENCFLIGKYNALDARDGELFVIGGGTSENDRKNVFSVNEVGALRASNFYPVGSIYETSVNANPEGLLGFGSWTLIDKEFIYKVFTSGGITWNTAACTDGSYVCLRKNHEIWFRVTWKNKIAYGDTDIKLFELNPKTFGLNVKPYYESIIPGVSDALGAYLVVAGRNESDTKFEVWLYETVYKNGATSSQTGVSCSVEFNWHFGYSAMADSTCKSFKWRRDS